MKNEKSPAYLTQSKITAFCIRKSGSNLADASVVGNGRKRKSNDEVCDIYPLAKKVAIRPNCKSPNIFSASFEKKNEPVKNDIKENNLDDFPFQDFENDPFLSPRKEKSPKKNNILTENCFLASGCENGQVEKFEGLNFETPVRCKVVTVTIVTKGKFEQILNVKDEKLNGTGVCKLRDAWTSSSFCPNDLISVQAIYSDDGWVVDNKHGYVVLYPNIIISSTSLVSSIFCMRQGLLSSFYKGLDTGGNNRMLIGRLIHELLQETLKNKFCSEEDFLKIINELLLSKDYLRDIYSSGMKMSDIENEMKSFVPQIKNFVDVYVEKNKASEGKNFNGTIEKVVDIEELIRSPILGLQGRIDVTVLIKSENTEKTAPLELKTGRASFSYEHRSQLILYVLLMQELGRMVHTGLLLYLREDKMEEVIPQRDEIRNLFLLRNHFVKFYKDMKNLVLPEPIRSIKACNKCPYMRVCTTYLKDGENHLTESHPLKNIEISDIKDSHAEYFIKWNKMLWLEYGEILEEAAEDFEVSGLKLQSFQRISEKEFRYDFCRIVRCGGKAICSGTFIHLMNGKNNRICTGRVNDITDSLLTVLTDVKLDDYTDTYKVVTFQSKFLSFYLSNLGWFLGERYQNLRKIIIDKKLPTFQEKFDKKEFKDKCLKFLIDLNKEQQKAVLKALLCNDYLLIKGPPGTGKTQTIVALIRIIVALGKTVLIASHTHTSIDNILLRLKDVGYLRLGALKNIHKEVHPNCYSKLIEDCKNLNDLRKLFDRKVFASTCSGLDFDFINKNKFDFCIVDESSQVLEPEVLRALFCSSKFILVGDEDQLPPIVQNLEAKKMGMNVSLFERLGNNCGTFSLRFQYRMNTVINSLANSIAYNGFIECADEKVAKSTIKVLNVPQADHWMNDVLSGDLEKSVVFINTSEYFKWEGAKLSVKPRTSVLEANIIIKIVNSLIKHGLDENNIGVIAPFCDQIAVLRKKLTEEKLTKVELNTVDQYQGRDKEVIFFSCSKENQSEKEVSESELLNDQKRLTVAVTRAKHKLVFVGDRETMAKYTPFQKLMGSLNDSQFLCLSNGFKNFFWANFVN